MKQPFRTLAPPVVSAIVLVALILARVIPTTPAPPREREASSHASGESYPKAPEVSAVSTVHLRIPNSDRIASLVEERDDDSTRATVLWHIPLSELALLLSEIESHPGREEWSVSQMDVAPDKPAVWAVRAVLVSVPTPGATTSDAGWITQLSPAFTRRPDRPIDRQLDRPIENLSGTPQDRQEGKPIASPPVIDAQDPLNAQRFAITTGGSGGVRFENRGTMQWLWDDTVLRLEPTR